MAFDLLHCTNINFLLKNLLCKILGDTYKHVPCHNQ